MFANFSLPAQVAISWYFFKKKAEGQFELY